ncbi:hypothetical protein KB206_20735 [Microvirga sp. STS02]|uniref:hypothetical protein n=1 Tax=Hymenobacter negativus TaxID=2795026 RepID=UPI0018DC02A9|nr:MULTISPECIES: hypothetical protein [Bacteria]MBH8571331.1 hypothetical protein [Hymenobacter negativus]MBR7211069.1 hypothetical protein [Microvirga sp. STS02]
MNLCDNVRDFSYAVFDYLSEVFSYELGFSELGLTDHFIVKLARFSRRVPFKVEVYKTSWQVETVFGNDIDLFVEDASGQYDWYALQAKVMSHKGQFKDLKIKLGKKTKKGGRVFKLQQWHKLLLHEHLFGSQAFYLLYVGKSKTNFPTAAPIKHDCRGLAPLEDYGLSLVPALDIMNTVTRTTPLQFNKVFPNLTVPISSIICCPGALPPTSSAARKFNRDEIDTSAYKLVYARDEDEDPYQGLNHPDNFRPNGFAKVRIIVGRNLDVTSAR